MQKLIAFTSVLTLLAASTPAFAATGDIVVRSRNSASIVNEVVTTASSGSNTTNGARANSSASGGNVSDAGASNTAGNGGNTVLGGMGGLIMTGNATANVSVSNDVNSNNTDVDTNPWATNDIRLRSRNTVDLGNGVTNAASSGSNTSNGKRAYSDLSGGSVTDSNFNNTAGNGGNHVEGGSGGEIHTGVATTNNSVVNVLNRNVTRVRKQ
jgi:uncharacterized Zn-finger protein